MAVPDVGSWRGLRPRFDALERDPVRDLPEWLSRWSALSDDLVEEDSRRMVAMTRRTDDPKSARAHLEFQTRILPKAKARTERLNRKLVAHPGARRLPRDYRVFLALVREDIRLFRKANLPLEAREARLSQRYQTLMAAQTAVFDGKEQPLTALGKVLEEPDRSRRKAAWETITSRRLKDRRALSALFEDLRRLRARMARNAGFRNYRDYAFRKMGRLDYGPAECRNFHRAVERRVMPAVAEIQRLRARQMGLERLRPWDADADPKGRPPLAPYRRTQDLVRKCRGIFAKVHPAFGPDFDRIRRKGYLDLDCRKGKAPGAYMTVFTRERMPFIFVNGAGRHDDVQTLLHEGGHAFHSLLSAKQDFHFLRNYPIEFAEVASMGMELLGAPHLGAFYAPADRRRACAANLAGAVELLPWVATIDAFQHEVYTGAAVPGAWRGVRERFRGEIDWSGLEEAEAFLWQRQPHLFVNPFYYIEYGIAQLGALQVWRNARRNHAEAVRRYREALALGWSRGLPELFRAAGLRFDFSERTLAPLVDDALREITRLDP